MASLPARSATVVFNEKLRPPGVQQDANTGATAIPVANNVPFENGAQTVSGGHLSTTAQGPTQHVHSGHHHHHHYGGGTATSPDGVAPPVPPPLAPRPTSLGHTEATPAAVGIARQPETLDGTPGIAAPRGVTVATTQLPHGTSTLTETQIRRNAAEEGVMAAAPVTAAHKRKAYEPIRRFEADRHNFYMLRYAREALYWQALSSLLQDNLKQDDEVLDYVHKKVALQRQYIQGLYKLHDGTLGDKKGTAAKAASGKGSALHAGDVAGSSWSNHLHHLADGDMEFATSLNERTDSMEAEVVEKNLKLLVKGLHKEMQEVLLAGDVCLSTMQAMDLHTHTAYTNYEKVLGEDFSLTATKERSSHFCEDTWLADMNYREAVRQQKGAWDVVSANLKGHIAAAKELELKRRMALRKALLDFVAHQDQTWVGHAQSMAPLVGVLQGTGASLEGLELEVQERVRAHSSASVITGEDGTQQVRTDHGTFHATVHELGASPADSSFIDQLDGSLTSPLIRHMGLLSKKSGPLKTKYQPCLAVLTWDHYLHLFELPKESTLGLQALPAQAFSELLHPITDPEEQYRGGKKKESAVLVTPTLSLNLTNSTASPVASKKPNKSGPRNAKFEIVEGVKNSGVKGMFKDTSMKTVLLRAADDITAAGWIEKIQVISNGGLQSEVVPASAASATLLAGAPATITPVPGSAQGVSQGVDPLHSSHQGAVDPLEQATIRRAADPVAMNAR